MNRPVNTVPLNVRQNLAGNPELPQRRGEREADRPPGGPGDDGGDDAVAGVVVDPGHDLGLGPVGQEHPADDVHLPKGHRLVAFPAQVAVPGSFPGAGLDKPAADQDPVDAHPRRRRHDAEPAQLVSDPHRTPPRVLAADLADRRLNIARDLVRGRLRPPRAVRQGSQAAFGITADPGMHTLPRHPEPDSDLRHRQPCSDLENSPVPLLEVPALHRLRLAFDNLAFAI
jgi:hypothetical protein